MKRIAITGGRGYIGSALTQYLSRRGDLEVYVIDNAPQGQWNYSFSAHVPYQDIAFEWPDTIIHLAAHSSVKACQADPMGAWRNNVTGFKSLLGWLRPDQRLIYASTAGVYHGRAGEAQEEDVLFPPSQLYDLTKRTMDDLARLSGKDCYGLRFGTLSGPAPVMRHDLVVNAMVRSAITTGIIHVQNLRAPRALLGMGDCVRAIEKVVDAPPAPGVYNVASFNTTIEAIAQTVAGLTEAGICVEGSTPHYAFRMDTTKGQRTFGIAYTDTLEGLCEALLAPQEANCARYG